MKLEQKKIALSLVSEKIRKSPELFHQLFDDKRELLGFEIRWLKDDLHKEICSASGLDLEQTEIILMQAFDKTECHLHSEGCSLFQTLGPEHGFPEPGESGILSAMYKPDQTQFDLEKISFQENELSLVVPYQIHAFQAEKGKVLTALGVVSPRIRQSKSEFDVVDFDYLSETRVSKKAA